MSITLPSQTPEESSTGRTRVLLVEDAASTRRLLRAVLESSPTFEVVGEADTGSESLERIRTLHPDVILLDLSLPDIDGAQLLPKFLDIAPTTRVVVLSNNARLAGPGLIECGATAYIEKGLAPTELLASLLAALDQSPDAALDDDPVASEVPFPLPTLSRAVIADDDPLVRREISMVLAKCGLKTVTEVVAIVDVADAVRSAVEMTGDALVVIGEVAGTAPIELIGNLAWRSARSMFIAYGTTAAVLEPVGGSGRFALVVRPDLIGLEHHARQFVAMEIRR